jgi:thiol-disulfide isomerase/thioredoxin
MQILIIASRLILFGVFIVAGLAKLMDRQQGRQAFLNFGVPAVLAGPAATVLPWVELAIGISLLPVAAAWYGSLAALGLLVIFVVGVGYNLAKGRTPECNCFGQLQSAPIGISTLIRNVGLACLAGLILWHGKEDIGVSLFGWFAALTLVERTAFCLGTVALALLATEAALLVQIVRQQGRLLIRLDAIEGSLAGRTFGVAERPALPRHHGLVLGSRAPDFKLKNLDGGLVTLNDLTSLAKPVLLLFTNPSCGPCVALMPEIGDWERAYNETLTIALLTETSIGDNQHDVGSSYVLIQEKREIAEAYQAWGTPAGVIVTADAKIGSTLAQGADAIRAIVRESKQIARPKQALILAETL